MSLHDAMYKDDEGAEGEPSYVVTPMLDSYCGTCGNRVRLLARLDMKQPAFFLCDCGTVGQVGVAQIREEAPWDRNVIQFARLLCELIASDANLMDTANSMDLSVGEVHELLDRAHERWEKAKEQGRQATSSRTARSSTMGGAMSRTTTTAWLRSTWQLVGKTKTTTASVTRPFKKRQTASLTVETTMADYIVQATVVPFLHPSAEASTILDGLMMEVEDPVPDSVKALLPENWCEEHDGENYLGEEIQDGLRAMGTERDEEGLYIFCEDWCPDGVTAIVQWLLQHDIKETPFATLEGASTCSKMRPGSFGGFAAFITRDDVQWSFTAQWLEKKAAEFFKEARKDPAKPIC